MALRCSEEKLSLSTSDWGFMLTDGASCSNGISARLGDLEEKPRGWDS